MEIEVFGNDNNIKVFSTDIINSLLNETNKEGMEIIFDVKKNNLTEEENNFKSGVNHIQIKLMIIKIKIKVLKIKNIYSWV